MRKYCCLIGFLFCCLCLSAVEKNVFEVAVRTAVFRQMQLYPKSTLKDLYKNFFQDKFGPGHLIHDMTAADRYLRHELSSYTDCTGDLAEPTGWEGNFLRVNLSVIKSGQIDYATFFDAFVRSVNGIRPVSVDEWQKEWRQIETLIRSMGLQLPDYEQDRKEIEARFERGEFVGHHSTVFEESYSPHYRIISREIYDKELRPLLEERNR